MTSYHSHLPSTRPVLLLTWALAFAAVCGGCTSSVHPLATKETLTQELDLTGQWRRLPGSSGMGPQQFTLNTSQKKPDYSSYWGDDGEQEFDVQVVKLDGRYYLDAAALDEYGPEGGRPRLYLPLHVFARVELAGQHLHLFPIEEHTSICVLEDHEMPVIIDENTFTVMTASTARLQEFVRKHWREFFVAQPVVFERVAEKDGGSE